MSKGTADFNGEAIADKRYNELSSEAQFEFLTYNITVTEFRECSFEEVEEMFYRVNQSVPLTSTEKTRVKVSPAVRETVQELGQHLFFEKIAFTKVDRNRYVDEQLIWQFIASASKQDIDFGGASLNQFIGFQEKLTEVIVEIYRQEFDLLFPGVPMKINREIMINENAFSVLGLISYWIKTDYMYSEKYMTEQMLKIAVFKNSSNG